MSGIHYALVRCNRKLVHMNHTGPESGVTDINTRAVGLTAMWRLTGNVIQLSFPSINISLHCAV